MYTAERYVCFMTFRYSKSQAFYWKNNVKLGEILLGCACVSYMPDKICPVCALLNTNRVRLCDTGCFTLDYILTQQEFSTVGLCSLLCKICTVC